MAKNNSKPIPRLTSREAELFWRKVKVIYPIQNCWEWQAALNNKGYGVFTIGPHGHTTSYLAHRLAYSLIHKDPGSKKCCHHCDNPRCCNPTHIFVGTQSENVSDMISKGRKIQVRGESHPRTRLTWEQVLEIRELYIPAKRGGKGNGSFALAERFGISISHLLAIVNKEVWKTRN